ncbi:aldo/keto reductase [Arthrobacter sp. JZ12]|uniref:aldo/keto reductase n=1 Tax=Arthrobacter sp. JZ12 TaxID=2654190 RepID=UPI002B479139|nr:aldo/keto reductase [Arthrobacter sp. JZ12]WRH25327.1 aldo/keto reductase [Arthrobacter sp. JZ12]
MTSTIVLNNGIEMPAIGLGVFQTSPDETVDAVTAALELGYRHIDTAAGYGNEREVGQALRQSGLDRHEVFIETKVWITDYGLEATQHAFDKSAGKLGLEVIDLLLLHQPFPTQFDRTIQAYKGLEQLLADGKVRAIGVSNFAPEHLEQLLAETDVIPAVNQIELHPYYTQPDVQRADAEHGIITQAWSPIGGITFYPGWGEGRTNVMQDQTIAAIANTHRKSPAQIMLRWHLQQGRSAIPKSVQPHRTKENYDIFDFELSAQDVASIDRLDQGIRRGPEPASLTLETAGFEIPEA